MSSIVPSHSLSIFQIPFQSIDASNADEFRSSLEELLKPDQQLLLDFTDVEFIDSAGLGAVVWAIRQISELKGEIRLCCAQKSVRALFELVRMNRITAVFEDREDAVRSFEE